MHTPVTLIFLCLCYVLLMFLASECKNVITSVTEVFRISSTYIDINLYHLDLTPHLWGQTLATPSIVTFMSVFYSMGHVDGYVSGLSELCHKSVTHICKECLQISLHWFF
jgi:hypothetical protein